MNPSSLSGKAKGGEGARSAAICFGFAFFFAIGSIWAAALAITNQDKAPYILAGSAIWVVAGAVEVFLGVRAALKEGEG